MKKRLMCSLMMMVATVTCAQQQEVKTVASVELDRYVGQWHEVARLPNKFQAKCAGDVTAEYRKREDGRIDVINRCRKNDGTFEQAIGIARVIDGTSNAKLKVRFAPAWLSWVPMVWGDYWIIALAPDYSYAVIGEPGREYLWILTRAAAMTEDSYKAAVGQAAAQGFDVSKLVKTRQGM